MNHQNSLRHFSMNFMSSFTMKGKHSKKTSLWKKHSEEIDILTEKFMLGEQKIEALLNSFNRGLYKRTSYTQASGYPN